MFIPLVPEYDITEPFETDHRHKRNLNGDDHKTKFYKLKAFGEELPLELSLNKNLMASDLKVEVMGSDGVSVFQPAPRNSFYLGKVSSDPDSMVAVSDAGGLVRTYFPFFRLWPLLVSLHPSLNFKHFMTLKRTKAEMRINKTKSDVQI